MRNDTRRTYFVLIRRSNKLLILLNKSMMSTELTKYSDLAICRTCTDTISECMRHALYGYRFAISTLRLKHESKRPPTIGRFISHAILDQRTLLVSRSRCSQRDMRGSDDCCLPFLSPQKNAYVFVILVFAIKADVVLQ